MASGALFIGWGSLIPGREKQAPQVFGEAIQLYQKLQQQGEIESFEPFFLEPHGGDLAGFLVIRGDLDKLNQFRHSDEFHRLNARAAFVVQNFGVVSAHTGADIDKLLGFGQEAANSLG